MRQFCAAFDENMRQFRERPIGEPLRLGGRIYEMTGTISRSGTQECPGVLTIK